MVGTISEATKTVTNWHDVVLQEALPLHGISSAAVRDVFFSGAHSEVGFGGEVGMVQGPSFTAPETERIRQLIKLHLVANARAISDSAAEAIAGAPLDQYHRVVGDDVHARLLSKLGRVLSADAVAEIKRMSFFDYVRDTFGPYYLSDEESIGHEQVCFRVVRPNRREDVGSLHRDAWFWDHFHFPVPEGISRVKVWVPVCGSPEQAGLLLAPGSHRRPAGYTTEIIDGKLAFLPRIEDQTVELRKFQGRPGDSIMFNYDVLHVGALTRGDVSRVSFEITIMFRTGRA